MSLSNTSKMPSTVEIRIHCRNLWKRDLRSQSDAFCVLTQVRPSSHHQDKKCPTLPSADEVQVGRTEVVRDTKDPDFVTSFTVEYHFEQEQVFILRVFDEDTRGSSDLEQHDYLGSTQFTLGQLMGAKGNSLARPLMKQKKGYVVLQAEEVASSASRDVLLLQLEGHNLKNTDGVFGLSDPFYQVHRWNPASENWSVVWKSHVVKDNLDPKWQIEKIPVQALCNNDLTRKIQIQILDWDSDGSHDDMGSFETTVQELLDRQDTAPYNVLCESKKLFKAAQTKKKGTVTVKYSKIVTIPTMLDYVSGGCQVSLMVAVDFTASNGTPSNPNSLHYRGTHPNEYQLAIEKIGSIVQEYDTNKLFPMWGFGASIHGNPQPCFCMGQKEEVCGVEGLLQAYQQTLETPGFALHGPTNFAPVIREAMQSAREAASHGNQCYSVLVMLTDGEITDFDETLQLIAKAANEPMSIVIIGVGNASFAAMEYLDDIPGTMRDIVQFVPFRKFSGNIDLLAKETLLEIPDQLVQFYQKRGIQPNPPVPAPEFTEEEIFVQWDNDDDEDIVV